MAALSNVDMVHCIVFNVSARKVLRIDPLFSTFRVVFLKRKEWLNGIAGNAAGLSAEGMCPYLFRASNRLWFVMNLRWLH